jgi:hypothetical protein
MPDCPNKIMNAVVVADGHLSGEVCQEGGSGTGIPVRVSLHGGAHLSEVVLRPVGCGLPVMSQLAGVE